MIRLRFALALAASLGLAMPASAQVAISALPAATTPLAGSEVMPIVQSAATKKATATSVSSVILGTVNTWAGKQTFRVPTTSAASINLPHGIAPTSPTNGDCWTTTAALSCRINGATVAYGPSTSGTVTSVAVSGGTTGLTTSGGPITGSGTITLAGTLAVANGGTGVSSSTGAGSVVLSTSPTLISPTLGTPSSVNLTNATGLPLGSGVAGTLPVSNGGTGASSFTSNRLLKGNGTSAVSASGVTEDGAGRLLYSTSDINIWTATTGTGAMYVPADAFVVATTGGASGIILNKTGGSTGIIEDFRYQGTTVGNVSITTTATAFNTSSDQRLKKNIADAVASGPLVDAIRVRQFDWKSTNDHQRFGFVAQELETVFPEAVTVPADPAQMRSVDYSKLVPLLLKEIQALRGRVTALENAP